MPFEPLHVRLEDDALSSRFIVLHLPEHGREPLGLVVHAPAFAEEVNKARRMVALQARTLAAEGFAVVVPDLLGCGDSPGDFNEATWSTWVNDIAGAARWIANEFARRWPGQPRPPTVLWGLRVGALLAAAAARRLREPCALVLWQPTLQGGSALQQFLRLLTAADIVGGRAPTGGASPRATLAAGTALEVAGYLLTPALANGMEAATLALPERPDSIAAFEVGAREPASLSPALAATSERWRTQGWQVHAEALRGPAFWQTTEIEDAPALIEATTAQVKRLCEAARACRTSETS
jgi:exosortase A-associated hydrolase 2